MPKFKVGHFYKNVSKKPQVRRTIAPDASWECVAIGPLFVTFGYDGGIVGLDKYQTTTYSVNTNDWEENFMIEPKDYENQTWSIAAIRDRGDDFSNSRPFIYGELYITFNSVEKASRELKPGEKPFFIKPGNHFVFQSQSAEYYFFSYKEIEGEFNKIFALPLKDYKREDWFHLSFPTETEEQVLYIFDDHPYSRDKYTVSDRYDNGLGSGGVVSSSVSSQRPIASVKTKIRFIRNKFHDGRDFH